MADMFGREKKKTETSWDFDLEKELKIPENLKKMNEKLTKQINELKGLLRTGEDKKSFEEMQQLLHGYLAAQKVVQRIIR